MSSGRNDPCPCGSGRKFKKCCGDPAAVATARAAALTPFERIAGKRDELVSALLRFAASHGGDGWMQAAVHAYLGDSSDDMPREEVSTMLPWALFHWPEDRSGLTIAETFRARGPRRLDPELAALLDAELAACFSIWSVVAVTPGVGLQLADRLTQVERFVFEPSVSDACAPLDTVLARVVDFGGIATLSGIFPAPLPPFAAEVVLREMRRVFRVRTRPVPLAQLRDAERQLELLDLWRSMYDQDEASPELLTTDGDPLTFVTDRYDYAKHDRPRIVEALRAMPGADVVPGEDDITEIVLLDTSTSTRRSSQQLILALVEFRHGRIEVSCMSIERADAARTLIEAAAGSLVRHRIRDETTAAAAMNRDVSPAPRAPAMPDPATEPEVQEALRQFRERYMQDWLDMSIPALNGSTPREAAANPKQHKALDLLLRHIEHNENHLPPAERSDMNRLRRELGVPTRTR